MITHRQLFQSDVSHVDAVMEDLEVKKVAFLPGESSNLATHEITNLHDNTVELEAGGVPADAVPPGVQAYLPLLLHGALEGQVVSLAVQVQNSTSVHYTQVPRD